MPLETYRAASPDEQSCRQLVQPLEDANKGKQVVLVVAGVTLVAILVPLTVAAIVSGHGRDARGLARTVDDVIDGLSRRSAGDSDRAMALRQVLAACENVLASERTSGPNSSQTVASLVHFGNVFASAGAREQAHEVYERALLLQERAFGPDSEETVSTMLNIADVWAAAGAQQNANEVYQRALVVAERVYGSHNEGMLNPLGRLGDAYAAAGAREQAYDVYRRALLIAEKSAATATQIPELLHKQTIVLRTLERWDDLRHTCERLATFPGRPSAADCAWRPNPPGLLDWGPRVNCVSGGERKWVYRSQCD